MGQRKDPCVEPDVKDYGTATEAEDGEIIETRSSASTRRQPRLTYTLDDNQKLKLRREHQRISDI